jgi:hypothetical protein
MAIFNGYLFSKLQGIGTKCEGPVYCLQQWDYYEMVIFKKTLPWQEDPELHKFLDKKVTIEGSLQFNMISYEKIRDWEPTKAVAAERYLEVDLKLEREIIYVHMDFPPQVGLRINFGLALQVTNPYRHTWTGFCPTTQLYDFFIEKDGKIIWQWSRDKIFAAIITPVQVYCGIPLEYPETWSFSPEDIKEWGTYSAKAVFIPSGQEVSKDFKIEKCR